MEERKTVKLIGGAPWGFRVGGGIEFGCPLEIVKIRKKGKADLAGLKEGDILVNVDGHDVSTRTHADAAKLLEAAGSSLMLGIIKKSTMMTSDNSDLNITLQSEIEVADDTGVVPQSSLLSASTIPQSSDVNTPQSVVADPSHIPVADLSHPPVVNAPLSSEIESQPAAVNGSKSVNATTSRFSTIKNASPAFQFYCPPPEHGLITCENQDTTQVTQPISVYVWRSKKKAVVEAAEEKALKQRKHRLPSIAMPTFNASQMMSGPVYIEEIPKKSQSQLRKPLIVPIKPYKKEKSPVKSFTVAKHAVELKRWTPKEISKISSPEFKKTQPALKQHEEYQDGTDKGYEKPTQFDQIPPSAMQIPTETHQLEGEVDGSCCGADVCKHSIYSIHNKKPPNHVPGMITSLMYDNTQGCYGTNLLVRPYKKIYSDSTFYDTPDASYPTIQEQVALCKQIAHNLEAPANLKSRGGLMFLKKKIRADKYAKVSVGTGSAQQQEYRSLDSGLPVKTHSDEHRARMYPDPIKSHLNAEELEKVHNNSDVLCKHDILPPTLAFQLSKDLKKPYSKAASIFAQLRERADYYTIDEHNVKKVEKPSTVQEYYKGLMQNFQYVSPWNAAVKGNLELAFAPFDPYAAETCTEPVPSLDESDLHHVLPFSKDGATFGVKYKDYDSVAAPHKPEPQFYIRPLGSTRFYPLGKNKLDQILSNRPTYEATYDTYSNKWIYPRPRADEVFDLKRPKAYMSHKTVKVRQDDEPVPQPQYRKPVELKRPKAYVPQHYGREFTAIENPYVLGPYGVSQHYLTYGMPKFRRPKEFLRVQTQDTSDFPDNSFAVNEPIMAY